MNQLVLASTSPRRKELLTQVGIPFTVRKQSLDESIIQTNDPVEKSVQLSTLKAINTELLAKNEVVLAADTIVAFDGRIYEKPNDVKEAYDMLSTLSGKTHHVYTGVTIRSHSEESTFVEKTAVEFWPLRTEEIHAYIDTRDPFDKAGAYGIQSHGAVLVKQIIGDYFNVVGLPISRVVRELRKFDIEAVFEMD